ncbi:putative transcription factor interactor and regulator CCHC(Zn) family [Helianthus anomalus]
MAMVFDEQENNMLEDFNNWYMRNMDTDYRNVSTDTWVKSFELFICQKEETLKEIENRFKILTDIMWNRGIKLSNDEYLSKLTTALPAKWDEFVVELKQKDFFPKLSPHQFFNEIRAEYYKEERKRREFLAEMEKNLHRLEMDVLIEVDRRVCDFLATKSILKYDIKRKCYIDDNMNPFDFVKLFRAGIDKMETKDTPKIEESIEFESSSSASACSKCDNLKTDNDKLVKDAESLVLKVKKLENEKQTDEKQILDLQEKCEKLKAESDKLLDGFNSLIYENKKLNEKVKGFEIEKTKIEKEFQNQMKILEDGRNVFSQNNIEKQKMINSHLQKIIKLEKEGECARKKIEKLENELERKQKSLEDEDFWIKLENKNLKANESKFQEQIKVLTNEKSVLENLKNENESSIKSHLERISQLEKEAENSRIKIDELEKKLIGFVTSLDSLKFPCPKPINSVPISDNVTNFDKVKVEDCDEKTDDENEAFCSADESETESDAEIKKKKIFLKLKENFQKTVLQSTEKGECSKQKPLKKKVEHKQKFKNEKSVQKENKSSSVQSSNRNQKAQKLKNENSKSVGNKWCRADHSASKPNPANLRKEYHQAKQCYDLSIWCEGGIRYDNRVCYQCGYQGHIAVNCRNRSYETTRCFNCNIKGHIARDCPRRSNERSRVASQKVARIPVKVKPQEQKVLKPNVQEQSIPEKKVKLSQGQKDRLRKKRKKAREYLEKILSSGSSIGKNKSSDKSTSSAAKSRKMNSSDTNLRTKEEKKKEKVGDESDRSKSDKPPAGNDPGSLKPEEPLVEVKKENSGLTMDDANFPPLLNKNSKSPKDRQAWVNLFK